MGDDNKKTFAGQMLQAAGPGIIGTGMGIATAGWQDRRQLKQQRKLNDLDYEYSNRVAEDNYRRSMKMWEETGPVGQMEQYKKAGLNPGLMYGMGGGGGQTAAAPQQQRQQADAPRGGGEIGMGLQMGMQQAMMAAQIELAKSQANKNNVEAKKTETVDTELSKTQTLSLTQGIENQKSIQKLTEVETSLKELDLQLQGLSFENRLEYIEQEAREMTGKASIALIQANLDTDARSTRLNIIKQEYIQRVLEAALTRAQTQKTGAETKLIGEQTIMVKEQAKAIAQHIMVEWAHISNEHRQLDINNQLKEYNTDITNDISKDIFHTISGIVGIAGGMAAGGAATPAKTPVGFKKY